MIVKPRRKSRDMWYSLFFLAPGLLLVAVTYVYPLYRMAYMSLEQSLGDRHLFVGLLNYRLILADPVFVAGLTHNIYLLAAVPAMLVVALIFAALLYEQRRWAGAYQFLLFVPYIISITVVGITFSQILTKHGILNTLLSLVGLGGLQQDWLGDPNLALFSVGAVVVWQQSAFGIILFYTRMLSLSAELFEAALIDGASRWRAHWHITLPQLHSVGAFYVVISVITVVAWMFPYVFVMTNGGPLNTTITSDLYIYSKAFGYSQMNLAAAASTVVFALTLIVMVVDSLVRRRS